MQREIKMGGNYKGPRMHAITRALIATFFD